MKRTWLIVAAFVVVGVIGGIILSSKISALVHAAVVDYVNERVSQLAREASKEKASVSIGDVSYSLLTGSVSVDNIVIRYDDATASYSTNAHISIAALRVTGLLPWDVLDGEGLSISEIRIEQPSFTIVQKNDDVLEVHADTSALIIPQTPNIDSIAHEVIVSLLPQNIAPLQIGRIAFVDASGRFENIGSATHLSGAYEDLDVTLENISIGAKNTSGLHLLRSVTIHIGQLRRTSEKQSAIRSSGVNITLNEIDTILTIDTLFVKADRGYTFLTQGIYFSHVARRISIDSFALGPTQTDDEYYADKANIPDRFRVTGSKLALRNVDMRAFQRRDGLILDSLTLKQCHLDILSSRRNMSKIPSRPPMIHQIIRSLPFRVNVASVFFTNTSIHYGELHPNTSKHAVLYWSGVTCSVKGLSTDTAVQNRQSLVFDARGTFMKSTPMQAVIAMPLNVKQYAFTARGSMGAIDARELNSFLPTAEKIKVSSGQVQKATFDVRLHNGYATGSVDPYYSNLNIEVLDQKTRKSTFILGIASWLANWVGVKNDNLSDDHKKGTVLYKSNPNDAIMQTIWYPIKDGLGDVIGF